MLAAHVPSLDTRRQSFELFNERGGKFRVAIINACNLNCFFCHNEGMKNPRDPKEAREARATRNNLSTKETLRLINTLTYLGAKQVNLTGGEPLAHPEFLSIVRGIEKRASKIALNTNGILVDKLLAGPKEKNLDTLLVSLHTTSDEVFQKSLGGKNATATLVMNNIVALKKAGYDVELNYSLGPYNVDSFGDVLGFAVKNGLALKVIALVREKDHADFYQGDWVDPSALQVSLSLYNALQVETKASVGGQTSTYFIGETRVKIKNIAKGRLRTDFCQGCSYQAQCGEGIYGLRMGVDALLKPCLLRKDKYRSFDRNEDFEAQVLSAVHEMVGDWKNAYYVDGAPL
jgi:cyclic pyranopterin phosphate synthase